MIVNYFGNLILLMNKIFKPTYFSFYTPNYLRFIFWIRQINTINKM